jgi:hypothetical protein
MRQEIRQGWHRRILARRRGVRQAFVTSQRKNLQKQHWYHVDVSETIRIFHLRVGELDRDACQTLAYRLCFMRRGDQQRRRS